MGEILNHFKLGLLASLSVHILKMAFIEFIEECPPLTANSLNPLINEN